MKEILDIIIITGLGILGFFMGAIMLIGYFFMWVISSCLNLDE